MKKAADRLNMIKKHLTSNKPLAITSSYDYFFYDTFLTEEEQKIRLKLREFLEKGVKKQMINYIKNCEVPFPLMRQLVKEFPGIGSYSPGNGSAGYSPILQNVFHMEMYRIDASISIALGVSILAANTIYFLGSEEQKKKFIQPLLSCEIYGCFALTEPDSGSDIAKNMSVSAKPVKGGYIINGKKTWVGNASFAEVIILWARNSENNLVQGFIIEKGMEGLTTEVIHTKMSARAVHNAHITFSNLFLPESNKLPLAQDFTKGAGILLVISRLGVAVSSVGSSMAAYDSALEYSLKRKQFGKEIAGFQMTQEKLYKIMSNTQAMMFLCFRLSELLKDFKLTPGMASMAKSWCSKTARENIRLAREIMGGNGILMENHIMTALLDVESQFTYEGAYDINLLLLGNELTGINAIV